jgi:hypothetical protein
VGPSAPPTPPPEEKEISAFDQLRNSLKSVNRVRTVTITGPLEQSSHHYTLSVRLFEVLS